MPFIPPHYLAVSGGVGGAKLALGLAHVLPAENLTIVANTGDDFEHLGLHISPDLDTVMYTLAGVSNTDLGWGLAGESWNFLEALGSLGGDNWFRLGDRDLATHVLRSHWLGQGLGLSAVTAELCQRLGIRPRLLPMSDDPVRTKVHSDQGELAFQHYFVRLRCEPGVSGFHFSGIEQARPQQELMKLLGDEQLGGVIICPSNPFVSVDPVLQLPGVRGALEQSTAGVVAVSPIVAGLAIKGPAAKMMAELGMPVTALAVAEHYRGLVDCFVLDTSDATLVPEIEKLGMDVLVTDTVMRSLDDRKALAGVIINWLETR